MKFRTNFLKIIAAVVTISMMGMCAFAANQNNGFGGERAKGNRQPPQCQMEGGRGVQGGSKQRFGGRNDNCPNNNQNRQMIGMGELDTDAISKIIAALEDDAAKDNLNKLLADYKDAVKAKESADSDAAESKLKELRDAVIAAHRALVGALDDAEIDRSEYCSFAADGNRPSNGRQPNNSAEPYNSASSSTTASADAEETQGHFQSFFDWLSSWTN